MRFGVVPALLAVAAAGTSAGERPWTDVPFLQLFFHRKAAPAIEKSEVRFEGGTGYFAMPAGEQHMPALLLTAESLDGWLRQCATEIAGIGYAVFAIPLPDSTEEASSLVAAVSESGTTGKLSAALTWLASRPSVDSNRTGAIAWSPTAAVLLRSAEQRRFQAVVILGSQSSPQSEVPVLTVARARPSDPEWIQIYEFLAKHVEDAASAVSPQAPGAEGIARVVDIMRAINSNDGVRGMLAKALAEGPRTDAQWEQARSEAAVLAEAGNLLLARRPTKGSLSGWQQRAAAYRDAARQVLRNVERRDMDAARHSLGDLAQTCANCHSDYR